MFAHRPLPTGFPYPCELDTRENIPHPPVDLRPVVEQQAVNDLATSQKKKNSKPKRDTPPPRSNVLPTHQRYLLQL